MNVRSFPFTAIVFVAALGVAGCTDEQDGREAGGDTDTSGTGDAPGTGDEPGTDDGDPEQYECAPDQLDVCPPATKCTAVTAADGHSFAYECVADKGELGPGDKCMPSPPTGVDGCPTGHACIPDTNLIPTEGHCLALCLTDDACGDGLCAAGPTSPILVCAESCNPLLVTCPATHACRMLEDRAFACVIPQPDDIGVQGAECDGINNRGCANGFMCMPSFQVPDCLDSNYCCTGICPVDGAAECPELATCQSLALDWPMLENVGVCTL